jgi:putative nucleotidyltransferase with HDIG domain
VGNSKNFSQSELKILIVDNDSGVRQVLSRLLKRHGYTVESIESGSTAIKRMTEERFDLVIADVMTPNSNGVELMERMRLLFPEILIVVISASTDIDAAIQAIQMGAAGFVLKPFRLEEIELAIRTALENRKLQGKRERMRIMTDLVEAGKEVSSSLDRESLSKKLVEYACQITDADTASLMLLDGEQKELTIVYEIGLNREFSAGYRVSLDESVAGWALKRCFCLNLSRNEMFTPELHEMMDRNDKLDSSICMPILTGGAPMGVLNVSRLIDSHKGSFESSDVDFLSILSSHAAVCLRNSDLFHQVQDLYAGSIQALSLALQAKDTYTGGHSEKVAHYTMLIADQMGIDLAEKRTLWTAAILHDLGKIGTPEGILNKPADLSVRELEIVQNHPGIGADIIQSIPALKHIAPIVRYHHEWFDGSGYPEGLSGDQIPVGARILSIADAIEAMTSDRPYRKNCPSTQILTELDNGKGSQFDPDIVEHVYALISNKDIVI